MLRVVGANAYLRVNVANRGNKTAKGATLQLMVPSGVTIYPELLNGETIWRESRWITEVTEDGVATGPMIFEHDFERSIYTSHPVQLCKVPLAHGGVVDEPFKYRILYDDGSTPKDRFDPLLAKVPTFGSIEWREVEALREGTAWPR